MYKRTVHFNNACLEVEYEYDEGKYLKLRKVSPCIQEEFHDELCEIVDHEHFAEEAAYWKQLYDGEVLAGFHDPDGLRERRS